jgi:hypothetical protein
MMRNKGYLPPIRISWGRTELISQDFSANGCFGRSAKDFFAPQRRSSCHKCAVQKIVLEQSPKLNELNYQQAFILNQQLSMHFK